MIYDIFGEQAVKEWVDKEIQRIAEIVRQRVGRCPECDRAFVKNKLRQIFCTNRCQCRRAARKFRKTPPDRIGKVGRPRKIV